mmetsp:Transcript_113129/g.359501  ORF Transcript_113129/g.359501 Transcript_113129/m.359501 type:complete len:225 (-) Transcript_113129:1219-1893(-)
MSIQAECGQELCLQNMCELLAAIILVAQLETQLHTDRQARPLRRLPPASGSTQSCLLKQLAGSMIVAEEVPRPAMRPSEDRWLLAMAARALVLANTPRDGRAMTVPRAARLHHTARAPPTRVRRGHALRARHAECSLRVHAPAPRAPLPPRCREDRRVVHLRATEAPGEAQGLRELLAQRSKRQRPYRVALLAGEADVHVTRYRGDEPCGEEGHALAQQSQHTI